MIKVRCFECFWAKPYGKDVNVQLKYAKNNRKSIECRISSPELTLKNECEDATSWPMVEPTDFCGAGQCKS